MTKITGGEAIPTGDNQLSISVGPTSHRLYIALGDLFKSHLAGSPTLYLFENWKRFRAPGCPYFLRSVLRESRVRNPSFFNTPRNSVLNSTKARATPCCTASACPCMPPPATLTITSNLFKVSDACNGRLTSIWWVPSKKYCSNVRLLTVKLPVPGRRITRAVAVFRRPVPWC